MNCRPDHLSRWLLAKNCDMDFVAGVSTSLLIIICLWDKKIFATFLQSLGLNKAISIRYLFSVAHIITLFILISPTAGRAQQFEAEGQIIYSVTVKKMGKSIQHVKHFTIDRNNSLWKIRTTEDDQGNQLSSIVSYEEVGCDGTNIFYLEQQDGQKLQGMVDLKVFQSDHFAQALGRVMEGTAPRMEPSLIYPVWLALASGPYIASLTNNRVISPLFVQDGLMPEMKLPSKWNMHNTFFLDSMTWFSEGKYQAIGNYGEPELKKYHAPYDDGFLQAVFHVTSWTNSNALSLPGIFDLIEYEPGWVVDNVTNFNIGYTVIGRVDAVRELKMFSPIPNLTTKTSITDFRYNFGVRTISYLSSSNWYSEQQITEALHRRGLVPISEKSLHDKKILVVSILLLSLIFPVAILLQKNSRHKHI